MHNEIAIQAGDVWLHTRLSHATGDRALVLIAERSAAKMRDSRDAYIAAALNAAGFATLQVALLSRAEEQKAPDTWRNVSLLATRLLAVAEWMRHQPAWEERPAGLLAHGEAAAAMIRAASRCDGVLAALASRSGRPDLAGAEPLRELAQPLLLLVGGNDSTGVDVNRQAQRLLKCANEFVALPGASQNFEEPGMLDQAARRVVAWFERTLGGASPAP